MSGEAEMRSENGKVGLKAGTSVEIAPSEIHQMMNTSEEDAEFIVVSMPKSHGDKVTL